MHATCPAESTICQELQWTALFPTDLLVRVRSSAQPTPPAISIFSRAIAVGPSLIPISPSHSIFITAPLRSRPNTSCSISITPVRAANIITSTSPSGASHVDKIRSSHISSSLVPWQVVCIAGWAGDMGRRQGSGQPGNQGLREACNLDKEEPTRQAA